LKIVVAPCNEDPKQLLLSWESRTGEYCELHVDHSQSWSDVKYEANIVKKTMNHRKLPGGFVQRVPHVGSMRLPYDLKYSEDRTYTLAAFVGDKVVDTTSVILTGPKALEESAKLEKRQALSARLLKWLVVPGLLLVVLALALFAPSLFEGVGRPLLLLLGLAGVRSIYNRLAVGSRLLAVAVAVVLSLLVVMVACGVQRS
jgi:hypothetical protein